MIREFNKEDIPSIYILGKQINPEYEKQYDLESYLNCKTNHVFVYEKDKKVIAFIHIEDLDIEINIVNIVVDEKRRMKGYASKLLEHIIVNYNKTAILEVRESNLKAIDLYFKYGFKVVNKRKNYYKDEDGLVMLKKIEKDVFILAVETTCDETSIAVVKNGKEVLINVTNSQIKHHESFGGVVPEFASRMHTENITLVLDEVVKKCGICIKNIDAVAVSYSPGLLGSLLVGVEFAKTVSYILDVPLIKINHLIAHIHASKIENEISYPLLALVISGGHTELAIMKDGYVFEPLGKTLDDAIGECFDKVARVIGIPYPGGPGVEKLAEFGSLKYEFPVPTLENKYDFSYSGLKSSVINLVHNKNQKKEELDIENIAYSFQHYATLQVIKVLEEAIKETKVKNIVLAGGVSANLYLRDKVKNLTDKYLGNLYVPSIQYCTDNAAMVGIAAYPMYLKKEFSTLALNPKSNSKIF